MHRLHQFLFCGAMLGLSWLGMLAVHELGHVLGAWTTRGSVERVVLHPLAISRTDVSPNPSPGVVVWAGPIVGVLLPLGLIGLTRGLGRKIAIFFAGFCLLANGTYISVGSLDRVGDCREMAASGTPVWIMIAFGVVTIPLGLGLWHALGSPRKQLANVAFFSPKKAYVASGILLVIVVAELLCSSR